MFAAPFSISFFWLCRSSFVRVWASFYFVSTFPLLCNRTCCDWIFPQRHFWIEWLINHTKCTYQTIIMDSRKRLVETNWKGKYEYTTNETKSKAKSQGNKSRLEARKEMNRISIQADNTMCESWLLSLFYLLRVAVFCKFLNIFIKIIRQNMCLSVNSFRDFF